MKKERKNLKDYAWKNGLSTTSKTELGYIKLSAN